MKENKTLQYIANICGSIAFFAAIIGVLIFSGKQEIFITRSTGVILVLFSFFSQKNFPIDRNKILNDEKDQSRYSGTFCSMVSLVGIVASLCVGYLIYFCEDNFYNRKLYVIISSIFIILSFALLFLPAAKSPVTRRTKP